MEEDRRDQEARRRGHEAEAAQQREDSGKNGEDAVWVDGLPAEPVKNTVDAQRKERWKAEDLAVHTNE